MTAPLLNRERRAFLGAVSRGQVTLTSSGHPTIPGRVSHNRCDKRLREAVDAGWVIVSTAGPRLTAEGRLALAGAA